MKMSQGVHDSVESIYWSILRSKDTAVSVCSQGFYRLTSQRAVQVEFVFTGAYWEICIDVKFMVC